MLGFILTACAPAAATTLPPATPCPVVEEAACPAPVALEAGACTAPTAEESAACPVASAQPAMYGLWSKELDGTSSLLAVTEKSIYLVETGLGDNAYTRESFFTVQSVDWVNGVLDLQLTWVRVNGQYGGFDSPSKQMRVVINDDALYYSLTDAGLELPPADIGPCLRQ